MTHPRIEVHDNGMVIKREESGDEKESEGLTVSVASPELDGLNSSS